MGHQGAGSEDWGDGVVISGDWWMKDLFFQYMFLGMGE